MHLICILIILTLGLNFKMSNIASTVVLLSLYKRVINELFDIELFNPEQQI